MAANSLSVLGAAFKPNSDDVRDSPDFKKFAIEHFADFPFSVDATPVPTDLPDADNVIVALQKNVDILKNSTDDNERAQALRFVIHFVGDIHQPLHCSTRVDSAHPKGDQGGNGFFLRVRGTNGQVNKVKLHGYWDGGLDSFPKGGGPPKFPPPPRIAQKRSGCASASTSRIRPSAVTTSAPTRSSIVKPCARTR